jgi:GT2 family glycosyltransferase
MSDQYSIVILTKDRPRLLLRAVCSALRNLADDSEVLVVDDHSEISASDSLSGIDDFRLRIVSLPQNKTGVAAARNVGFTHARGEVIFFLDDDDELIAEYCSTVMTEATRHCDYGFSGYLQMAKDGKSIPRIRLDHGPIPVSAPLKKKICGFGMGFWIKNSVAQQVGPVSTDLTINEDTDYLCRLITSGIPAWYNASPSIIVHTGHEETSDVANMTETTTPMERARCMRIVCDRFPNMIGHLGASYVRHCAKVRAGSEAWAFIRDQPDWHVRTRLASMLLVKLVAYRLRNRLKPIQSRTTHA